MTVGKDLKHIPCATHHTETCVDCNDKPYLELCFVQRYEVLDENVLEIDLMDKTLNCLRLRRDQNPDERMVYEAGREFGLVTV